MSSVAIERASAAFQSGFGTQPEGVAFAPGRVNLIGDHVDYNDGLVLPMPMHFGTAIAWRRTGGTSVIAQAADFQGEEMRLDLDSLPSGASGWQAYVQGMVTLLTEAGLESKGVELAIAGDLPRGAGLSSSASLCIAIGRALALAWGGEAISEVRLAQLAQQVEHRFAGVACGIMDQMACAAGRSGSAMLLDCRDLSLRHVPLPAGWTVLIVQSGVTRELVDGEYNLRRQQCEEAARVLGLASLRDATSGMLAECALDATVAMRAQHVIEEIARTLAAAEAIETGELAKLGQLLRDSHCSLRDLFEVSHRQVDHMVELLNAIIGADGGARMTGGGFGGAIVAICLTSEVDRVRRELVEQLQSETGVAPDICSIQN